MTDDNGLDMEVEDLLGELGRILEERKGSLSWDVPIPAEQQRAIRELHRLGCVEPTTGGRNRRWRLTEAGVERLRRRPVAYL